MGSITAQHLYGGPLSDVAVVCGGRRFDVHRAVLAMASPVFLSMLDSGMAEGGAPEVELKEADPVALELLLRHAYGAAVDVPLALAPQLFGLADRFQLRSGLAEHLMLFLSTVDPEPAVLCELLPVAHAVCAYANKHNLCKCAAKGATAVAASPIIGSWPLDLLVEVMEDDSCTTEGGFAAAAAWMAAQPRPAKQRHRWPELLDAVGWGDATYKGLRAIRRHPGAASVPGLQERLLDAYHQLCRRLTKEAAARAEGRGGGGSGGGGGGGGSDSSSDSGSDSE